MEKIDLIEELEKLKKPVWQELKKYLPKKEPVEHYKMVAEYPSRQGKYFRPGLLLLSAEMFGADSKKALLPAVAIQLSEEWLLAHDDFMDHSLERRSTREHYRPTLNMLYGDELAVLAGDALYSLMWQVLEKCVRVFGQEKGLAILRKMNNVMLETIEGQFYELDWIRREHVEVAEKEYFLMIKKKSARYTTMAPLQLGAMVAGAGISEIKRIEAWAVPFGCAFQVWDDAMNLSIQTQIQGKEKGGDILEGKRTLSLIHLLKNCTGAEKAFVSKVYLKPREDKTESEKERILKLMEKYGSIEHAKKAAREMSKKARELFDKNTRHLPQTHAKEVVREAISFVVNRDR